MRTIVNKWPMILGIAVVIALAGVVIPWVNWDKVFDALEAWRRPKLEVVSAGPMVLLVSTQERDRYLVKSTLEPRGYALRVVDTVEQAREVLDQATTPVAMVVVDSAVPGSKRLFQDARAKCPKARLIELRGRRDASEVTGVLVNAVSGT